MSLWIIVRGYGSGVENQLIICMKMSIYIYLMILLESKMHTMIPRAYESMQNITLLTFYE